MDQTFAGAVPILAIFVAWLLGEYSKRRASLSQRKEKRYEGLLHALTGFYVDAADRRKQESFLDEWRMAWLYCPDRVVRVGNRFLATVQEGSATNEESRPVALSDFVSAIRKDLHRMSRLSGSDFVIHSVRDLPDDRDA